ncbi:MAG: hypothetical protein R2798_00330 [Chitinophagales bacterium]|nr:phosphoglucomutase/phosphomannomutase family protein [Bacteroidota bacterium]MCB9043845.1 phosphoglucomutase/phosphomannomutase family protein [Chitinophagales bacterium]
MSDIKFGTDGWRAIIAQDYTTQNVARITEATAIWLKQQHPNPSIVVGHDCRFAGALFTDVVCKVMAKHHIKVFRANGIASTPMVSLGTNRLGAQQGIVITASHNPPSYNGYKLKSAAGGPTPPAQITAVENLIPETASIPATSLEELAAQGLLEWVDLENMYYDEVQQKFDLSLMRNAGLRIAYDAMYGAGQQIFPRLFPEAYLLHCDYNPSFMGRAPEPLHKNLPELAALVPEKGCHAGLANDGDADRIGMYDENGKFLDAHHIILLVIYYLCHYKKMNGKVVIAFSVTDRVKKLCTHFDLDYVVTKIGFKYICEYMVNEDVLLGGEESGGIAVKGHIPERDGIWIGLLIFELMAKTGKSISQLIDEIYQITGRFVFERNDLHLQMDKKEAIVANCKNNVYTEFGSYKVERLEDIDGYKYHLGNERWVMIRPSGTEPVLRIYAEAENEQVVLDILAQTKQAILA